ncbi:phosphotransferase [Pyruvatibacter sp.]|uniref:phosphotransferase family protein n=1 Tax=Pyruvatibacter sp. TaxID=1981328 RepID=UPI003264D64D
MPRTRPHPTDHAIHAALSKHGLPPPPWTPLGSGVWGDVFDLHDGSVLKLVCHSGGIGSGQQILDGETAALQAAACLQQPIAAARFIAGAKINPSAEDLGDYCGWIRMSKLPGRTAMSILAGPMDFTQKTALMCRLGETVALLHTQTRNLPAGQEPMPTVSQDRLLQIADIVPDMRSACLEVATILAAGPQHPFLHGDINGGNVLFASEHNHAQSDVGLVDWGEAQSGPVEIELRHMTDIGGPAEAMIEGYEAVSNTPLDPTRLNAALSMNALGTLAIATLGTVEVLNPDKARQTALARLATLNRD